ncbi:adenylate/guanylate cyclase domain-containing protein [Polyangium spumosum]|uniref:2Fe-2S iron-sulfur cluster binding domain-containing protein n=1 Tax=Polyangium spumosum TaxID=889282 RepID=A0A6N7Q1D5_9BACT|nr:adenylate/guanylate cyclase domain-containing protein [Polyangium spumosum]MRG97006.1 2Fe-2S iron-sulfur cluster binding domain-containing protein [Polyangium spumosum]
MATIHYAPDGISVDAPEGQTLLAAALSAGVPHIRACGGNARCSTCRVVVLEGLEHVDPRNEREQSLAEWFGLPPSVRMACQTTTRGPVRVRRLALDQEDVQIISRLRAGKAAALGARLPVAILVADIRGFTEFSASLEPYDVIYVLNRYFEAMGRVVAAEGGFINNYMGDGLSALFGADGQPEAASRAVRAALGMLEATAQLAPYLVTSHGRAFDIGIGIHLDEVVVGPAGASDTKLVAAMGGAVDFACRVESANEEVGSRLLVSEPVYRAVADKVSVGRTARIAAKRGPADCALHEITALR